MLSVHILAYKVTGGERISRSYAHMSFKRVRDESPLRHQGVAKTRPGRMKVVRHVVITAQERVRAISLVWARA